MSRSSPFLASLFLLSLTATAQTSSPSLGVFQDHGDVGTVLHPGSAAFDDLQKTYTLSASGENMWSTADDFQFLWKKASGDVSITADIAFPTKTGNPHKKAVLMIRQSLDTDSEYVDAALHVEGLTSLQSRDTKGGATHEVGIASASPTRLRIEKRGDYFFMYLARPGEELHLGGGSMRLALKEPFYIGLGVCAHDKDAFETAVFSNVVIGAPSAGEPKLHSTLETISVSSTDRRVVAVLPERIEAPNWTPEGASPAGTAPEPSPGSQYLYFSSDHGGKMQIWRIHPEGSNPEQVTSDEYNNCAPSLSPDGKQLAFLSYEAGGGHSTDKVVLLRMLTLSDSKIKILARLFGGQSALNAPSWSPDSRRLAFVSYQLVP